MAPFNPDERERLILEHLSLVRHLVARVAIGIPAFVSREDLVSAGVAGLIEAIDRFDPNRNCSLKTYCTLRVRGAILDELRRLNWAPRSVQRDSRALSEAHERLAQKLGREPSEAEIRDELGMTAEEFDAFLDRVKPSWFSSLQEPATSSDESSPLLLEEVVPDARAFTAGEQMLRAEDIAIVRQQLSRMPQREAQVLALYYLEDLRLKEIAEVLQVTESRVSQIHTLALAKLRSAFEKGRKK